jgi:hypothetical protein
VWVLVRVSSVILNKVRASPQITPTPRVRYEIGRDRQGVCKRSSREVTKDVVSIRDETLKRYMDNYDREIFKY